MADLAKPMNIKFFLRNGAVIEWPVPDPEHFSFVALMKAIRADGHFIAPDVYIPHEQIACIGLDGVRLTIPGRGKPN